MFKLWERITGLHRSVFATLLCNIIEHYDFIVYGILSGTISRVFFLNDSRFSDDAYIASFLGFLVFATAFLARPLGALLFGYIGDKKGRKVALNASTLLLVCSTLGMALLPTPNILGIYSIILLSILRIMQGLAYGAETGGVVLMAESVGDRGVRIIWSVRIVLCAFSMIVGVMTLKVSEAMLSAEQMQVWGWRIPFVGAVLISFSIPYLRGLIRESTEYVEYKSSSAAKSGGPMKATSLLKNIGVTLLVATMASLSSGFFYIPVVYLEIGRESKFLEYEFSLVILALCASTGIFVSDFAKRRISFICCLCAVVLCAYPVMHFIREGYMAARLMSAALSGLYLGWYGSFVVFLFPIEVRQRCFSLGYSIGYLMGALAPALCLWFHHNTGLDAMPGLYLTVLSSIILAVFVFLVKVNDKGRYVLKFSS